MTTSRPTALIVPDSGLPADFDLFATPASVPVRADRLQPGMVLLDPELGMPSAMIDHRNRAERGSGEAVYLIHDLDANTIITLRLHTNRVVQVMAA